MSATKKASATHTAAQPKTAKSGAEQQTPGGYVWVSRTVTTVDDTDDDRAPGYVHIPGQEEPRLVDAKSVPELEVLGYRVIDAPKPDDDEHDEDEPSTPGG